MVIFNKLKKGLTMVELAVVLVIIGVIVGISIAAYKGVKNTTVHIEWQTLMDEAYSALIRYGSERGYLPKEADWKDVFSKTVNDFTYGGSVVYKVKFNGITDTDYVPGGKICSLKASDFQGADHTVFSLSENSARGSYKLASKNISLEELKTALKCPGKETPLQITTSYIPEQSGGSSYYGVIYAIGGQPYRENGEQKYDWCIEVTATGNEISCVNGQRYNLQNMPTLLTNASPNVKEYRLFTVSDQCKPGFNNAWIKKSVAEILFKQDNELQTFASFNLPITVNVKDKTGTIAKKTLNLTHVQTGTAINGDCN